MSSPVEISGTDLQGVYYVSRQAHSDNRGEFSEIWNEEQFHLAGWSGKFRQDCVSFSRKGVLRGIHIQEPVQAKLMTLLRGKTLHVAVDLREESPTFGSWELCPLSADTPRSLLIEPGFGHGFLTLEDSLLHYKCSELHAPKSEWSLRWDDPTLAIEWPTEGKPILSPRDSDGLSLQEFMKRRVGV